MFENSQKEYFETIAIIRFELIYLHQKNIDI